LADFIACETNGRFVVPIGRLDKDSYGLLLLTTEESVTGKLLRPSATPEGSVLEKEYHVVTNRKVKDADLAKLRSGMEISVPNFSKPKNQVITRPCVVEHLRPADATDRSVQFVLREGKNRQLRKMLGALGYSVADLKRVRFGPVHLGDLAEGEAQRMTDREVHELLSLTGLIPEGAPSPQNREKDIR
jgi:pseudouridine synthase